MSKTVTVKRPVSNEDVLRYDALIEKFIKRHVIKNWRGSSTSKSHENEFLGNSGWTLADVRQHLRCEVFIALSNYNPNFISKSGRPVAENTLVYQHLSFRVGQLMKRLTKPERGYGFWSVDATSPIREIDRCELELGAGGLSKGQVDAIRREVGFQKRRDEQLAKKATEQAALPVEESLTTKV